jgi:lipid-A-disaccharide synthase
VAEKMKPKTFMLIAGETSGDLLAAELVFALRAKLPEAKFFGAGGTKMAAAGVELAFDMTQHAATGVPGIGKLLEGWRLSRQLLALAIARQPDAVIGVDYGFFNLRFGHTIKEYVRNHRPVSPPWNPKLVQFVSPQVWASRPKRANRLEADYDLLLSIFPFEKKWYAQRAPKLRVEFVGNPKIELLQSAVARPKPEARAVSPQILLLPGSRRGELKWHLPPMLAALKIIQKELPAVTAKMILPNDSLVELAKSAGANLEIHTGDLPDALATADVAIAKTGTVTMECAFFGLPTVTLYKGSWLNYQIARRLVTVKWFTMPNILADAEIYPEFLQNTATPENLARAALDLLQNEARRKQIKLQLADVISSFGEPGAAGRAADAVLSLFP